ncbi:MAG TPA: CPBP family glutamic-type intramembrane protease [Myxococcales bacterium]|nr:CPBP family glutamic-type intramembrane protease [Myxococcales bacterium]
MLPRPSASQPAAIAPAWHTASLVIVFAASGFFAQTGAPATQAGTALAQAAIAAMLALYVAAGMRLRGHRLHELFGRARRWDPLIGLCIAALLLGLWLLLPQTSAVPPSTLAERALWLPVAAVVASSEELVFRGYFQRQFDAWGAGFWLAALAQAAIFAAAHAHQAALYAGVCGLAFACLTRARGGLLAAVAGHFALDACATFWP